MSFAGAFTALEALNWAGAGLQYRPFGQNLGVPYPADLPCVVTLLADGDEALNAAAVDYSTGLAVVYLRQNLLIAPVTIKPVNPFGFWDAYLGLWVGNLTLGGALIEPVRMGLVKAGAIEFSGNLYWGLGVRLRWASEVL